MALKEKRFYDIITNPEQLQAAFSKFPIQYFFRNLQQQPIIGLAASSFMKVLQRGQHLIEFKCSYHRERERKNTIQKLYKHIA
jgi:hypothetical protein